MAVAPETVPSRCALCTCSPSVRATSVRSVFHAYGPKSRARLRLLRTGLPVSPSALRRSPRRRSRGRSSSGFRLLRRLPVAPLPAPSRQQVRRTERRRRAERVPLSVYYPKRQRACRRVTPEGCASDLRFRSYASVPRRDMVFLRCPCRRQSAYGNLQPAPVHSSGHSPKDASRRRRRRQRSMMCGRPLAGPELHVARCCCPTRSASAVRSGPLDHRAT